MPKVICIDLRSLQMGHESRGVGMHIRSLLENLTRAQDVTYVFYAFDESNPIEKLKIKLQVPYTLIQTKTVKRSIDSPKDFFHLSKIIWHTYKPLRNLQIDVFVQFDFMLGLPSIKGVKTNLIAYDLIPLLFPHDYIPSPWHALTHTPGKLLAPKKAVRAFYYRRRYALHYKNFQKADHIISISKNTTASIISDLNISPEKITTIPLAPVFRSTNSKKPANVRLDSKGYIFYIGATDGRKHVQDLVAAYNIVRGRGIDINLVLAGKEFVDVDKIPNVHIKQAIIESSYRSDIINLGYMEDEEKLWLYQNALAFVFPTLYEGFGIPVLEAMQNQCAVVSYSNSSIPEIAGNAALLVESGNIEELAQKIITITSDKNLRESLIRRGAKQAKQYSWKTYANDFIEDIIK